MIKKRCSLLGIASIRSWIKNITQHLSLIHIFKGAPVGSSYRVRETGRQCLRPLQPAVGQRPVFVPHSGLLYMGKSGKRFKTGCVYSKKLPPAVRRQKKGSQLAAHNQGYVPDRYPPVSYTHLGNLQDRGHGRRIATRLRTGINPQTAYAAFPPPGGNAFFEASVTPPCG